MSAETVINNMIELTSTGKREVAFQQAVNGGEEAILEHTAVVAIFKDIARKYPDLTDPVALMVGSFFIGIEYADQFGVFDWMRTAPV